LILGRFSGIKANLGWHDEASDRCASSGAEQF
jgi:hypothetical protein